MVAASAEDLVVVRSLFNMEAEKISPLLKRFDSYSMNRGDYCANILLHDLEKYCPPDKINNLPQMIMWLIKRSDVPVHYTEWNGNVGGTNSYYLKCNSSVVNCYWKKEERQSKHPDCQNIGDYHHLIRFEVQAKYPKMYQMTKKFKEERGLSDFIDKILSEDVCAEIVTKYFNRVIKPGDYYTFGVAKRMIESQVSRWGKVERLVHTLKLVVEHGGIANAKAALHENDKELEDFRQSLRDLARLGINPVTIPDEWRISYLPNLLDAFYKQLNNKAMLTREEKRLLSKYNFEKHVETLSNEEIANLISPSGNKKR